MTILEILSASRGGIISLRIVLLLLLLLLLSAFVPWLLIPLGLYFVYKVGRRLYKLAKALKWPRLKKRERVEGSTSMIGDVQVYEVDGVGPALVVKNGLEALGIGCLEVRSLGGGRIAELLNVIDATARAGFESSLIVSRRSSGDAHFIVMIKVRRPLTKDFLEMARDVVGEVLKGLTAAMGAIKARLPRSEIHVLEFDELLRAVRGVVA